MSDALDAAVVLALATKAGKVFAQDETTVSFPLAPVVYRREDLSHMLAGDTAEGIRLLGEVSRLVNSIPTGPLWAPVGDRYVWDVYGEVLWDSELATAKLTAAQKKKLKKASTLLHVTTRDGLLTDSPAVVLYRRHRDAWLVAQQEYNNRKGTAEASTDAEVKARWTADEPGLRAQVEDAERRWTVEGRRAEIENAQAVERKFIDGSPAGLWGSYRKLFDLMTPEIVFATDAAGGRYVPTTLSPGNALDVPWARMTVDRSELTALADAAPAALRSRLPAATGTDVESISFEYTSVTVVRPWLSSAAFASRAWRFQDPGRVVSDGAPEPAGECPMYVAALVLARSVTVNRRSAPVPASGSLGFLKVATRAEMPPPRGRPGPPVIMRAPIKVAGLRAAGPAMLLAERESVDVPVRAQPRVPPQVLARLRRDDFERVPVEVEPTPPPPPPPAASSSVTTAAEDVYVLGFVCRRVPRSPNPDPALRW